MRDGTATHGTVLQLVARVENKGQKLYTDNYFSSLQLSDIVISKNGSVV
jgi:hypothetical protein